MATNQSPEFLSAQKRYLEAKTTEEKIPALEEMIRFMPKHKSGEAMRANLRQRYKKLKAEIETKKARKKSLRKDGIKKEGIQVVLLGFTQTGKSSLLSILTNAKPVINNVEFTTKTETIGMLYNDGLKFQIIDTPAINYESFDSGLINSADILLIVITNTNHILEIEKFLNKSSGKKIVVFNKSDFLSQDEKRKIFSFLQSKKYSFSIISAKTQEGIDELKKKLAENSNLIRVYTKEPGKIADKEPVLMKPNSTVQNLAEKIFHSKVKIREIRVTGPSSKFPNQHIPFHHILKDKDIVEFRIE